MKKIQLLIYGLLLSLLTVHAADKNTRWHTYLAMYNTVAVAEAENNVYAVADGTLYSYGKSDDNIRVYSRQTGLSDSDVRLIRYNASTRTLVIAYANGNIDLMTSDGIYNLPFLKNTTNIQDKTLNAIDLSGDRAYLSANFGILVIDLKKREVAETYRLDRRTTATALLGGSIYAATDSGLLAAATTDNLMDVANWKRVSLNSLDFDDQKIVGLGAFRDRLCFVASGGGLFYRDTDGSIKTLRKQTNLRGLTVVGNRLVAYTAEAMYVFASLEGTGEAVSAGTVNGVTALTEDGRFWVASGRNGLIGLRRPRTALGGRWIVHEHRTRQSQRHANELRGQEMDELRRGDRNACRWIRGAGLCGCGCRPGRPDALLRIDLRRGRDRDQRQRLRSPL